MTEFKPSDLIRMDADRIRHYKELLSFYQGTHWAGRERQSEKRLTFNYSRVIADKLTSYLMSGLKLVADPIGISEEEIKESQTTARKAEEALREISEKNSLEELDYETEIDCSVLGDGCYKVVWDAEIRQVKVSAPDVQGIYTWSKADDLNDIRQVASRYIIAADDVRALYDIKSKGKTVNVVEVWTATDFQLFIDDIRMEHKPNPYSFIPFIIFPNLKEPKRRYGVSDLEQIMEPQREFNRAMSQLSRILELSGNPIAVLENVESSQDIAVKPGAVWNVPEDAKAYLLDLLQGGGVQLHIDYINLLYRTLHDVSESPRAAFGGTERDLSGTALEIELQPLLQKVARKRLIRSVVYTRRANMILKLLEQHTGADFHGIRVRAVWGGVLPRDTAKIVANEQVLVQGGIHSRRTAMDELGVTDPEREFARWLEERETILGMNRRLKLKGNETEKE